MFILLFHVNKEEIQVVINIMQLITDECKKKKNIYMESLSYKLGLLLTTERLSKVDLISTIQL